MTGGAHAEGVFSKLIISTDTGNPRSFETNTFAVDFLAEDMAMHKRIIGGNEIRGTRTSPSIRTREGARFFYGPVTKYISPAEMDNLIPLFLGDESTDVFAPDENIPYFDMLIDRSSTIFNTASDSIFRYTDCKVDKATFRARAPQMGEDGEPDMVTAQFDIIGSNEGNLAWPSSPPAFGGTATYAPYVFQDAVVLLGGIASTEIEEFAIVCSNHLRAKYTNSLTPYSIYPRNRSVFVVVRAVWNTAQKNLYGQAALGATGYIQLVNGTISTKFEFGSLQVNSITPTARKGKDQIECVLEMVARSTSGNAFDLKITNDVTV